MEGSVRDFSGAASYFAPVVAVGDSVAIAWLVQPEQDWWDVDLQLEIFDTGLVETRTLVLPGVMDFGDRDPYGRLTALWRGSQLLIGWEASRKVLLAEIESSGEPRITKLVESTRGVASPWLAPWMDGFVFFFDGTGSDFTIQRYLHRTIERRHGVRP